MATIITQQTNVTFFHDFKGFCNFEVVAVGGSRCQYTNAYEDFDLVDECTTCGLEAGACNCPSPSVACSECGSRMVDEQDPFLPEAV